MTDTKLPKTLCDAARSGRLIPFVGAGVSMAVRRTDGARAFPSWVELLDASAKRLDDEHHPEYAEAIRALLRLPKPDLFDVAKRARDALGSATWRRFLVEQFDPSQSEIDDESLALARAIWGVGSKLVITTNYDRVLSWACPQPGNLRHWRFQSEGDFVDLLGGRLERPSLWQLHGSIDEPNQLVLTPDGYRELYGDDSQKPRHQAALTSLHNLIAGHHLLFVGFSLDDEYVARQFDWVHETFCGCAGPHYVLVRAAELARTRAKLEGTGVQAIPFADFGGPLLKLLRQITTKAHANAPLDSDKPQASVFQRSSEVDVREDGRLHVNIPGQSPKSSSPAFGARGPARAVEPSDGGVDVAILVALKEEFKEFETPLDASAGAAPIPSPMKFGHTEKIAELEQERDRRLIVGEPTTAIENEIRTARRLDRDGRPLTTSEVLSDRYELLEYVGSGGFATVWRAHDRSKGGLVAIKVLHGQWMHERSRVERFMSGARRLQAFRHQSIVGVLEDPVLEGDRCYYAMEWLPGCDLRRAVLAKRIDRRQALTAIAQALTGLAYAHEQGVIHRDVTPGNVLLDKDGRGRLSDFDLAHASVSTHGTLGGLGTIVYAAPEQLDDASKVDARADIYGSGMTVLFALLGKDPPPMVAIAEPKLLDELPCGPTLRRIVREAVAYKSEKRTVSCEQLIAAVFDEANAEDDGRVASPVAPRRDDGFRAHQMMPSHDGRLKEIVEELLDALAAELVNEETIASLIAETNAAGYYADSIEVLWIGELDLDAMEVAFKAAMHFTGDQDEEQMFFGVASMPRLRERFSLTANGLFRITT